MLEKLQSYFAYDFVRFALVVGVLVALCAALLGVTLVLRRYSMIGDGLSHMAFGAMTVAMLFSIAPIWLTLPVTVVSAVLLLRSGGKLKGDAAVAMLSVSSLAMGYLLLKREPQRRRLRHSVRLHVHPDAEKKRRRAVRRFGGGRHLRLYLLL